LLGGLVTSPALFELLPDHIMASIVGGVVDYLGTMLVLV
jgi:hypothetical protein